MKQPKITVLRLQHRIQRDQRLSTHVFLTARALGAVEGAYSGEQDQNLVTSINNLVENWGGDFSIHYVPNWKAYLTAEQNKGRKIIHLSMYGVPLTEGLNWLRNSSNQVSSAVIVVGGAKVPGIIFELADINISVGNQPHSEVAALAILLYEWLGESQLYTDRKGKMRIEPSVKEKRIIS